MAEKVNKSEPAFRVLHSFRDIEPGQIVCPSDFPDADFEWLQKAGAIKPLVAGGFQMSAEPGETGFREALDRMESMSEELEEIRDELIEAHKQIKGRDAKLKIVGGDVERLSAEKLALREETKKAMGDDGYLKETNEQLDRLLKENTALRIENGELKKSRR